MEIICNTVHDQRDSQSQLWLDGSSRYKIWSSLNQCWRNNFYAHFTLLSNEDGEAIESDRAQEKDLTGKVWLGGLWEGDALGFCCTLKTKHTNNVPVQHGYNPLSLPMRNPPIISLCCSVIYIFESDF